MAKKVVVQMKHSVNGIYPFLIGEWAEDNRHKDATGLPELSFLADDPLPGGNDEDDCLFHWSQVAETRHMPDDMVRDSDGDLVPKSDLR